MKEYRKIVIYKCSGKSYWYNTPELMNRPIDILKNTTVIGADGDTTARDYAVAPTEENAKLFKEVFDLSKKAIETTLYCIDIDDVRPYIEPLKPEISEDLFVIK